MTDSTRGLIQAEAAEGRRMERFRLILRWLLAAAYLTAGVLHLRSPDTFIPIVPNWVPLPTETVLLTGVCEIVGSIALLTRRFRFVAGVLLAIYAVCVFPANIKHAIDGVTIGGTRLGWWYHVPRLAFQPVIVWWALFAGQVTDWPLRKLLKKGSDERSQGSAIA